jgi:hypothetical protein
MTMRTSTIGLCIGLFAAAWPAAAQTAAGSSCGCGDIRELQARYCAAREAKGEYDRMIDLTMRREKEKPEILTTDNRPEVQQCTDNVIAATLAAFNEKFPGANVGAIGDRAVTDDKTCATTVFRSASSCTKEVLLAHEDWHAQQCKYHRDVQRADAQQDYIPQWLADTQDWRVASGQSLVSYMLEERTGYQLEQLAIMDRLQKLYQACPPKQPPPGTQPPKRKYSIAPCPDFKKSDYKPKDPSKECKRQ